MGTVVCFEDIPPYPSIHPQVDNDLPAKVYSLIDGQQRLTVSLISALVMHEYLNHCREKIHNESLYHNEQWKDIYCKFRRLYKTTTRSLYQLCSSKEVSGDKKYYPRIIRGPKDCWSTTSKSAQYKTSISELMSTYVDQCISSNFSIPNILNSFSDLVIIKFVRDIISYLSGSQSNKYSKDYSSIPIPSIEKMSSSETFQKWLFDGLTPLEIFSKESLSSIQRKSNDIHNEIIQLQGVARVISFATYFLKRVKYVRLVTTSQDHAYNIFDSLNTTGDPLTAIETFVPEVVKQFKSAEEFDKSEIGKMIDEIKEYQKKKTKQSQNKYTKDLVISFALAESGTEEKKGLSKQRTYLIKQYIESIDQGDTDNGKEYITNLMNVARVNEVFTKSNSSNSGIAETMFEHNLSGRITTPSGQEKIIISKSNQNHMKLTQEALFCLKPICNSGHRITVPIISRFYSQLCSNGNVSSHKDLCNSIRSITAFFALWRATRSGTKGIDAHHRKIMYNANKDTLPQLNYARKYSSQLEIKQLQNELCRILVEDRDDSIAENPELGKSKVKLSFDKWYELSKNIPIYETQANVAKFILLIYSYSNKHKNTPSSIFGPALWDDVAHSSIDHIIPRSKKKGESQKNQTIIDSIGNLTLLPGNVNSYLQDVDPLTRSIIFALLGYDETEQSSVLEYLRNNTKFSFDQIRKVCKISEKDLPNSDVSDFFASTNISQVGVSELFEMREKIKQLYDGAYLPTLQEIAQQKKFDYDAAQTRGKKIMNEVWQTLKSWLGSDTYTKGTLR